MFDVRTSELLKEAPSLPTLNADSLPSLLTHHYAEIVSLRLKGTHEINSRFLNEQWPLERIADVYETIASVQEEPNLRRSASFVAGTARLMIARSQVLESDVEKFSILTRDSVDPSTAAAILFLAAEQYADAFEAESFIPNPKGSKEVEILGLHIKDMVTGKLNNILSRAKTWRNDRGMDDTIQNRAFRTLSAVLAEGIELLASYIMSVPSPETVSGKYKTAQEAFSHVIELSHKKTDYGDVTLNTNYAGPSHLASLLLATANAVEHAALTKLLPPVGANKDFWGNWLNWRANVMPFLWPNHRSAIEKQFYQTGQSSVLVLPTGAGKTTVSVLKIAGTLAREKKVIFIVPTHTLVEQITEDLQEIFPKNRFGLNISNDFDSLFVEGAHFQDIEVMTPERCLAMLSFNPTSFDNIGLLVFDECHLLSPQSGKIRRSLDGMLCLLAFHETAPQADMLFLSAMLKNGQEFADWIADLTKRPCEAVDLLWKPSRQARGVVVYHKEEINIAKRKAYQKQNNLNKQMRKNAKSLRAAAERELKATPHVVWGLQNNWLSTNSLAFTKIMNEPVQLIGKIGKYGRVRITPNANKVATQIALNAKNAGLKTIIFVNTKDDAVSTSRDIANKSEETIDLDEFESRLWDSLILELGHSKHSIFTESKFTAVPHNASMLRLERMLSEKLFRRKDGAKVIVATPTLAQGLNLPANLAILAGDKRMGDDQNREDLEAHELLNAAARAGRAGHLANGVVILIPEPIITFLPESSPQTDLKQKLLSILPENDQCVTINDPLQVVLDRISEGKLNDREVQYTVNRLASLRIEADMATSEKFFSKSFGSFISKKLHDEERYEQKIGELWNQIQLVLKDNYELVDVKIASQSGLPLNVLGNLRMRLSSEKGNLPISISRWIDWTFEWLIEDNESRAYLLQDVYKSALIAIGQSSVLPLNEDGLLILLKSIHGWIEGKPLNEIEKLLGGNPEGITATAKMCLRARELVSNFIPRGLSFILMIVARMVEELELYSSQKELEKNLVTSLSIAVRKGFNTLEKLEFANKHKHLYGRVQLHILYDQHGEE